MTHQTFYGAKIPKLAMELESQGLANITETDLVKAHLSRNYGYFGAIDKTLAGFMILNDEGDDYMLCDLRDPKAKVYFQDHEERYCSLRFESLTKYKQFLAECEKRRAKDDDFYADDLYGEKYRLKKSKSKAPKGAPSSMELLNRYQWLVWFFAQPMRGTTTDQSAQHYASRAAGGFGYLFKTSRSASILFKKESQYLGKDAHLAIYWLLHATILCDDELRDSVLDATKKLKTPLFVAFKEAFGDMELDGALPVLKDFSARRSHFTFHRAFSAKAVSVEHLIKAIQIDAKTDSLLKAINLVRAMNPENETVVRDATRTLKGASTGRSFLRAYFAMKDGAETSKELEKVVSSLSKKNPDVEGVLYACCHLLTLVRNQKAVHPAIEKHATTYITEHPFALPICELLSVTATQKKKQTEFAKRTESLRAIDEISTMLRDDKARTAGRRKRTKLKKNEQQLLARKIITDPRRYEWDDQKWGFNILCDAKYPGWLDDMLLALRNFGGFFDYAVGKLAPKRASDRSTELFLRALEVPETGAAKNFSIKMDIDRLKENAAQRLSTVATDKKVFARLMKIMDTKALVIARHQISEELLDNKGSYTKFGMQHTLSDAQAKEAIKRIIAHSLSGEPEHTLYYFRHKGAEDILIEALNTVTNEDTVGSLYSAVRNMGTQKSKEAIVSRLFVDERDIWRLLNAIEDLYNKKLHKQILAELESNKDHAAINRYFWGMVDFVKNRDAAIDVLKLAMSIPAKSKAAQSQKKMVLLEGVRLANEKADDGLAVEAWTQAQAIKETPISIYHQIRKMKWDDPLDAKAKKAVVKLAAQKATEEKPKAATAKKAAAKKAPAEKLRKATAKKSKATRKAPVTRQTKSKTTQKKKPATKGTQEKAKKLGMAALAKLAKAPFYAMMHKDGAMALFIDDQQKVHYYDGFTIAKAPFKIRGSKIKAVTAEFKKVKSIDDRVMFWKGTSRFVEWMRCGSTVFTWADEDSAHFRNVGTQYGQSWVCTLIFDTAREAKQWMTSVRENPPVGHKELGPYYIPKKGAIVRRYMASSNYVTIGVVGHKVIDLHTELSTHASEDAAIKAYHKLEIKQMNQGSHITRIEWLKSARKPEDKTFKEYFDDRRRDDDKGIIWHMDFFFEIDAYLKRTKLTKKIKNYSLKIGKGATKAQITKVEKALKCKVPKPLADMWLKYGSIQWQVGDEGMHLLSPVEMLARREQQAEWNKNAIDEKMSAAEVKRLTPTFKKLQVLVEDLAGDPITVWCAKNSKDLDVFTEVEPKSPASGLWFSSLSWTLCTQLSRDFLSLVIDEIGKTEAKAMYQPE